ncbi:MAG: L-threonylcarbamoyladenylate synthase [Gammaproteobacteria bacterium]|nr:L-threonylcarbamoyladenylate synthase [Gammaproteobacteria bacterium]MDH5729221.1 L-threonylcarbamoyladenylate synthase [Gammaproteobacteria bacterium]
MGQSFEIHPDNPQPRLIAQTVAILRNSGVIAYPTDSSYALGCQLGNKAAVDRIRRLRNIDSQHNFTLVCRDMSEVSLYAKIDNIAFRLLKSLTPGPYTFILPATGEVPRRLVHPKRKTIGLRIPDNQIVLALLESLGEPIMSTTLIMPGQDIPIANGHDARDELGKSVDLVIDGGPCGVEPTTVIDLTSGEPVVARQGKGEVNF